MAESSGGKSFKRLAEPEVGGGWRPYAASLDQSHLKVTLRGPEATAATATDATNLKNKKIKENWNHALLYFD